MKRPVVRKGEAGDIKYALRLVRELAVFERAPDEVEVTEEEMRRFGFGAEKVFDFFVLEIEGTVVGMALYYLKYSTWKGRCLFLEDLVITESERGKGYGTMLFRQIMHVARELGVRRMEWQVLEWNEPAIAFYRKWKAHLDPEWLNGKLTGAQLQVQ